MLFVIVLFNFDFRNYEKRKEIVYTSTNKVHNVITFDETLRSVQLSFKDY